MARLPTALDLSGPDTLRTKRMFASADQTAAGRGLSSLGASIEDVGIERRQRGIVQDGAMADGSGLKALNDFERTFDADTDYSTFDKRFQEGVAKIGSSAAAHIRDPQARQQWLGQFQKQSLAARERVLNIGQSREKEARLVNYKSGLEGYQSVIADPDAAPDVRETAKRNAEAFIAAARDAGDLSPAEADTWRENVIKGGEFVYGQREIEKDPSIITGKLPPRVADRSAMAMKFFEGRGYSKHAAAGIVGNLLAESSLDISARNGGDGSDGSDSIGIAQWNSGRATALKQFAADKGADWRDFGIQLAFIEHELNTSEKSVGDALRAAGDIQAATDAAVMYERPAGSNKGPRNAHNYKGRLKFAAQAAGETVRPDWFTAQAPEKQFQLEQFAAAQQRQNDTAAAAQLKAEQANTRDTFALQIATSDPLLTRQQILDNPVLDNGDKASLVNIYDTKMKDTIATGQAVQAFATTGLTVDPYDTEGRKLVDGVAAELMKAQPQNVQPLVEELVRQTGVVPKQTMSSLRQGLTSMDTAAVEAAAQAAQRISMINPAALSRRDGGAEVQQMADDFNYYVNTLNLAPADAAQRLRDAQDPTKKRDRKAIEPAAKEFVKAIEKTDLSSTFGTWFGSNPDVGFSEGQKLGIQAEFAAIAEDQFYRANGDPEIATNRAVEQMKRLYGVTEMTGRKVIMKHPPERYWPALPIADAAQSLAYPQQLADDIKAIAPMANMDSVQLVTTPETDAMVKRGEMPGYAVLYTDENGVMQTIPGKLWRPDISKLQEMQEKVDAAARQKTLDNARAAQPQERAKAPYMTQTPQDFLSGNDPLFGER